MSLQKAYFKKLPNGIPIFVSFNPTELTFSKSAQFAEIAIPGLDAPVQQFVHGAAETLSVELFFDTTEEGMGENATSVTNEVDQFYELVKQDSNKHAPPICLFAWGPPNKEPTAQAVKGSPDATLTTIDKFGSNAPFWFTCIVESIERKFLLFSTEGVPLRARLAVKLREYQTVEAMVNRLQSADHTKARVLQRRERLEQIANKEYENSGEWRRIAEANDIDDPRNISPGTVLQVPPLQILPLTRRSPS